jgi:hypothetical protein
MMNTLPSQARVMHEGVSQVRPPTHTAEPRSKGLREVASSGPQWLVLVSDHHDQSDRSIAITRIGRS